MMEHSFERGNVSLKEMYLELIKLMLDREERVWPEGYPKTRDIHRLQSFQELTNRYRPKPRFFLQILLLA